jgi:hypothetical protein
MSVQAVLVNAALPSTIQRPSRSSHSIPLDKDGIDVSLAPRVMTRFHPESISFTKDLLRPVVHANPQCPTEYDAGMRALAAVPTDVRLQVLRPAGSGL